MRKKKVLLFIDSLENGGAQRQIVLLANVLSERNYDVTLLTYYPGDQLGQFLARDRVRHVLLERHSKFDFGYFVRLFRFFRTERPDCIISYLSTPNFFARVVGKAAGVPRIVTSERNTDLGRRPVVALLERVLAPLGDTIVVNSDAGRRELLACGLRSGRVVVIYNGVDCRYFCRQPSVAVDALREALGVTPKELLILLPGRMERQKNHALLLDAVERLDSHTERLKVAFAGNEFDRRIRTALVARIEIAGLADRFLLLGPRMDMQLLYSAADVVVLPSLWEGFPNVVAEAMACATPVIVSNVSDNASIVQHGITGYLFESEDVEQLAAILREFVDLSQYARRVMGERAMRRIAQVCSVDAFGDRYGALIEGAPLLLAQ